MHSFLFGLLVIHGSKEPKGNPYALRKGSLSTVLASPMQTRARTHATDPNHNPKALGGRQVTTSATGIERRRRNLVVILRKGGRKTRSMTVSHHLKILVLPAGSQAVTVSPRPDISVLRQRHAQSTISVYAATPRRVEQGA